MKNRKNLKAVSTVIVILIGLLFTFFITSVYGKTEKVNHSEKELLIIDTNDYTTDEIWNIVENRNGKIIIVVEHGIVENPEGDGNGNLGYIKYHEYEPGTKINTYLIYNPDTNYWDDIIERFDYMEE